METKNYERFRKAIMKHKICNNCGAVMTWDYQNQRYICLCCGNSEPTEEELKAKPGSYIN